MGLIAESLADTTLSHDVLLKCLVVESITAPNSASILSLFKDLVPKSAELIASFVPSLSHFLEDDPNIPKLDNRSRRKLLEKVHKVNFLAYDETLIFVPEGFKGKMIPYLELLLDQSKVVLAHGKQILADYNLELSKFLADADIRQSLSSQAELYGRIRKEREGYQAEIKKFFDAKNPTVSRQKLKTIIDRFTDLDKVFVLEEKLATVKKQQDYRLIVEETKKASDMLKLIKHRLDAGDVGDVSSQVARNLAEGAYEVAKYAEYMAIYGYYVETALASVSNTAEKLNSLF